MPPDFDLESLSIDEDDFSMPLAIAFHFGHLRYAPGKSGPNRGSIERSEDRDQPVWRPFANGIVRAVERLHEEPGERAEFQELVEEAWQGVSQTDRKKHLREAHGMTVDFLQDAHQLNLEFSVRDGIHLLQYALKRLAQDRTHPLAKDRIWREALVKVLGEEALDLGGLARRRKRALGDQPLPQGLGDFFFEGDDPLHPGR